ncbi:MAG TPA: S49 family peptidase, partial [Phycisphaerae bacterium]|nr:S49 family peptidase [Phycisphaerae bacterium]
ILGCLVIIFSIMLNFCLLAVVAGEDISDLNKTVLQGGSDEQVVAVYCVNGVIDDKAAEDFSRFYRTIGKSGKIRAVVLRIDSPGGGIAASDEIYKMVTELKAAGKKVVVSMGGVAASGGYYISAPANYIFAEPATITGSIGVIMQLLNLEGTMNKLGMKAITITSSNAALWKDQGSPFRQMSKRERENFVAMLNSMQSRFESIVTAGRPKLVTKKETYKDEIIVDGKTRQVTKTDTAPFNGQIYGTAKAINIGLVDEQGYLPDAWKKAASLAGLKNAKVVQFTKRTGFLFEMADGLSSFRKASSEVSAPRFLMQWGAD